MLNRKKTFDNYIEDVSNRFAISACRALISGNGYNPVFVYGASGCGKTHLLMAIKNEFEMEYPEKKEGYFTAEEIVSEFLDNIKEERSLRVSIGERCLEYDTVLFDGIEDLLGKETTQDLIFHLIDRLVGNGKQVVMACAVKPKKIRTLYKRLMKSFKKLLICNISVPSIKLRKKYAMRTADELELKLSRAVIKKISKKYTQLTLIRGEILALKLMSDSESDKM